MANFWQALQLLMGHEGGYVNDPNDPGGETYHGIARVYWPNWHGWQLIDHANKGGDAWRKEPPSVALKEATEQFYAEHFWDPVGGSDHPQALSNELFEMAVNLGTRRTVEYLQSALNLLNRQARDWPDIEEDGRYGPTTKRMIGIAQTNGRVRDLEHLLNILQGMHYVRNTIKDPRKERYLRGWLRRTVTRPR